MIERYGKVVNMRKMRSIEQERDLNANAQKSCETFFDVEDGGSKKCRICGSPNISLYHKGYYGFNYYECGHCKSLYLENLPKVNEMYREAGCNAGYYIDDESFMNRVNVIAAPKVDFVLEACKACKMKVNRWLDVGSGGGQILHYVKSLGISECGIESDKSEVEFSQKRGYHVINAFINPTQTQPEINAEVENADVISLITVLEHIEKPDMLVDYFKKHMKKSAMLVIEVPRHPSVSSFACRMYRDIVYRHMCLPIHLQIFNDKTFDVLFGSEFETVAKWEFGQGFSDLVNFPVILSDNYDNLIYDEIMKHTNEIQKIIDEGGLADTMFIVARKMG